MAKTEELRLTTEVGDGAVMFHPDPTKYRAGGLCWHLTYGDARSFKGQAVSVIQSFDFLLDEGVSMKEATRRLRLLRSARKRSYEAEK